MNSYYRAIGFENFKHRCDMDEIIDAITKNYTSKNEVSLEDGYRLVEYKKDYGDGIGIAVRGERDPLGNFVVCSCYPYFKGSGITTTETITVEERKDQDFYAGVCDEMKLGIALVFHILNSLDYINHNIAFGKLKEPYTVTISGLSISGSVLLPISKNPKQIQAGIITQKKRNKLLTEARKGDEEAMESLTLEDMDIFYNVSRKARYEDIFTLIDTYFMPYGVEGDQYSVMGEILEVREIKNEETFGEIIVMKLNCNDLVFDFCINKKDLTGEPAVGRRFKGILWLQGKINIL
ncbi:protein of unknown function [Acetitomaculum ruminis DSM 5522]|uniref:Uncharacterized protein n=1 Tax=Acetitomaculum ruminis DSM 5522 TaxID=1120918 RepID=A0A1I0ZDU5_9FIRM|nr:DUF3881 family protein [Acetitomaculum ruminis]SFB22588.1 protein of unknown function [Acetitomaculum ruminis DSM 5522]